MKVLSLFDGYSTVQQAFKESRIKIETCYSSEIDNYAIAVTQANFPKTIQVGSVTELKGKNFKNIDLIIGGSPCQDLSIAKKNRQGLEGSKSGLFWDYVRLLKEIKPKYFILENVASMPKEAREQITNALGGVQPIMINASLVSAQNRKRLFWVGRRVGNKYETIDIKLPKDKGILLEDILEKEVDEKYFIKDSFLTWITGVQGGKRVKKGFIKINPEKAKVLMARDYANWSGNFVFVPEATKKGYKIAFDGNSVDLSFLDSKTRRGRVSNKVNNLMTSQNIAVFKNGILRKLTPTECLRLQSMPDKYFNNVKYKEALISDTQKYKMCGNAFNCAVIKHILKHLK